MRPRLPMSCMAVSIHVPKTLNPIYIYSHIYVLLSRVEGWKSNFPHSLFSHKPHLITLT